MDVHGFGSLIEGGVSVMISDREWTKSMIKQFKTGGYSDMRLSKQVLMNK